MRDVRVLLLLVPLLVIAPSASAATPAYTPSLVTAATYSGSALVSWAPGSEAADSYNVYGLAPNAPPTLLGTFTVSTVAEGAFNLAAPSGFAAYAVSGVLGGVESPMVSSPAMSAGGDPCIEVDPDNIIIRCIPVIGE